MQDLARISVVVATAGRPTLEAALRSIHEQMLDGDEIVLVNDGGDIPVELLTEYVDCYDEVIGGDRGYTARNHGIGLATGTHLAFLDDDDVYLDGALQAMRRAAADRPVVFRMDDPDHGILWDEPVLKFANVGTPMFLIPNDRRAGRWEPYNREGRGGDFVFLQQSVEKMGAPIWRTEIVAQIRPHLRVQSAA